MSDSKSKITFKVNGTEEKTPFLIGVGGGTASGKASYYLTFISVALIFHLNIPFSS